MRKPERNPTNESRGIDPNTIYSLASAPSDHAGHRLIQQKKLRQKLGDVSPMWLFRHKDELPAPLLIAGRRFWREEEINAFIERLSSERKPVETHRPGEAS